MGSLDDWLVLRRPPAPAELKAWWEDPVKVVNSDGRSASIASSLIKGGMERAVAMPGRNRDAAYRLLAADAWVTYACEAASEVADVRGALGEVLGQLEAGGKGA